jgi:hypothetical protein
VKQKAPEPLFQHSEFVTDGTAQKCPDFLDRYDVTVRSRVVRDRPAVLWPLTTPFLPFQTRLRIGRTFAMKRHKPRRILFTAVLGKLSNQLMMMPSFYMPAVDFRVHYWRTIR